MSTPRSLPTELLADGLRLRKPVLDDAPLVAAAVQASLPELQPWLPWATDAYDETSAAQWINTAWQSGADPHHLSFLVWREETLMGVCGLNQFNPENRYANLGYWTVTGMAGQGVASRATRAVAEFAFTWLGLNRVDIQASTANLASQRAAEKAGAVREGVLRRRLLLHGAAHDTVMYSLLAEDLL